MCDRSSSHLPLFSPIAIVQAGNHLLYTVYCTKTITNSYKAKMFCSVTVLPIVYTVPTNFSRIKQEISMGIW